MDSNPKTILNRYDNTSIEVSADLENHSVVMSITQNDTSVRITFRNPIPLVQLQIALSLKEDEVGKYVCENSSPTEIAAALGIINSLMSDRKIGR